MVFIETYLGPARLVRSSRTRSSGPNWTPSTIRTTQASDVGRAKAGGRRPSVRRHFPEQLENQRRMTGEQRAHRARPRINSHERADRAYSQVHYVSKLIFVQNLGRLDNLYIFGNVITWRIRKSMFTFMDIPPWRPFLDFQNGGHAGMSTNANMYF